MPVISTLGAMSSRGFGEFNQQAQGKYIEDYFSTWLYTGNGSSQTISNGVALADTAAWSNITSTLDAGYRNTFFVNANGIYYAGANGANTSSVIGVNTTTGATLFNRNLSGTGGNDFYNGISGDSAGNIICVGRIATGLNASIVKYNSSGSIQWQRQISGGGNTAAATCVACDSSNNIYVGGFYTTSYSRGLVAKYNSAGVLQWQVFVYDTASATGTNLNDIVVGASGDVYICGNSYDAGAYPYAFVAKINTSGVFQWSRSLKVNFDAFDSISIDSSDNVYVCGRFNQIVTQYGVVAKYNSSGTLQWQIRPSTNVTTYDCASDSSGNVYVNIANLNLTKISTSGSLTWTTTIKPTSSFFYGVQVYGTKVYASCPTAQGTAILATDGTTTSGQAGNIVVYPASNTITTASATSATATVAITTSSLTESALSQTDSAGSLTSSIYTQAAVTGAGGLVWTKPRNAVAEHELWDTVRGAGNYLVSNTTAANVNLPGLGFSGYGLTAFTASGFTLGQNWNGENASSNNLASWTWRKTPKFFDVQTAVVDGSGNLTINHSLGSVPGMVILKNVSASGNNGLVYHRSTGSNNILILNSTSAAISSPGSFPTVTSTQFVAAIGTGATGNTYVAYLFAHDAGGFGLDGTQNVISCGSFTVGGGGSAPFVNLGYEPQFLLTKLSDGTQTWLMNDSMRGLVAANQLTYLQPNSSAAEATVAASYNPSATGFTPVGFSAGVHIYMAIRRGPMKVPTDATTVFSPSIYTGTLTSANPNNRMLPATDVWFNIARQIGGIYDMDRLRGWNYLETYSTAAETTSQTWNQTAQTTLAPVSPTNWWGSSTSQVDYYFKRAPSFMDEVCYTGTGAARTVNHNLGVAPELMIFKSRNTNSTNWAVLSQMTSTTYSYGTLQTSNAFSTGKTYGPGGSPNFEELSAAPTASVINIASSAELNASGRTFVAYLFASCPGVSKVGTYTGTGSTLTIDCGFTGGARYVMIKRTDTIGDWWFWDTARGMVSGTDPRMAYNSSAAEGNNNWVYTTTGGFQIVTSDATVNASGGTYIYLAIA